ncbi:hypothetical protein BE221DRAFT_194550 [Ostreococcus tauri]|uniref:U2 snRNP-associated SURP motif-containing protein n=1 Tax=Ostreococcus tauri TaxID=70448 RepID=A0A1Y5I8Z4_OSTTA|nr:hypothetical protein BE221DRAFT_194550 [Ostreococcus tauri]
MRFALDPDRAKRRNKPSTTSRRAVERTKRAERAERDAEEAEKVLRDFEHEFGDDDAKRAREDGDDDDARAVRIDAATKRARVMDVMLEEFVANDERRHELARERACEDSATARAGGRDTSEGTLDRTTNIRVHGLPRDVDEVALARSFERFGGIASVKIWQPREGEIESGTTGGYVCFMSRTSAERAVREMRGATVLGSVVDVEEAKAMRLPERASWPTNESEAKAAELLSRAATKTIREAPRQQPAATSSTSGAPDVIVRVPEDDELRRRIDVTAAYVAEDGVPFERALKARELQNEEFRFLFDASSDASVYYRWRVFAFAQGDGWTSWRIDPFIMFRGGARWIPPSTSESAMKRSGTKLSPEDRKSLEEILRHITTSRDDVRDAMEFAVERAECAGDVVDVIASSLIEPDASLGTVIARLYVVSDILHNASAPVRGVQAYRTEFSRILPRVFASLERLASDARVSTSTRDAFTKNVIDVLHCWSDWCVFADTVVDDLRATFGAAP